MNTRAETLALKPYFRHMLSCIIPASGFYETYLLPLQ
ncbi:MAG: SOS response-associated peptidase family protein [Chlorobiaceae bacterium]